MDKEVPMLFANRPVNWDNRDYRAYCDHRTRQKRRLRLQMFIGLALALMVGMLLVATRLFTLTI
jgi:predicted nucleic acid-binding Zn ribbon protein